MSVHGYPPGAVWADYARAGAGLALVAVPLAVLPTAPAVTALLTVVAVLFGSYGAGTVARHLTRIEIDEEAVSAHALMRRVLAWRDLDGFRLSYYATRRDRSKGWLELTLCAGRRRLKVDSRLNGFDDVLRRAVAAARRRRLPLDPATISNLQQLGLATLAGGRHGEAGQ